MDNSKLVQLKASAEKALKYSVGMSKHYQEQIRDSKTPTKKRYFLKKLKKNNNKLADLLVQLDYITKSLKSTNIESDD